MLEVWLVGLEVEDGEILIEVGVRLRDEQSGIVGTPARQREPAVAS